VRAQNIAAVWNHCHPWQFWLNDLNYFAGRFKQRSGVLILSKLR